MLIISLFNYINTTISIYLCCTYILRTERTHGDQIQSESIYAVTRYIYILVAGC